MEYHVEVDQTGCATNDIEGFGTPTNSNYLLTTLEDTTLGIDLSANELPAANTFTYKIIPLHGPSQGTVVQTGVANGPTFDYTPNGGYTGYDYLVYEMTDAQGRTVRRMIRVSVGTHLMAADPAKIALLPFIDQTKVVYDQTMQTVRFAIYMPLSAQPCDMYRMTIKQPAMDCARNKYENFSCYDVIPKSCG